jgi:L-ribulose-5-phosphate 3-epimerase
MISRIPLAAITDEFSPDLDTALDAMASVGMTGAELRIISGKNIIDLTDDELDRVAASVTARGMQIVGIASPLLKCTLPDAPPLDTRFQQDVFASRHTFDDQAHLARRAFQIAHRIGAPLIRVFSFWRTLDPPQCFDRIAAALRRLADEARDRGVLIGLENEHACNVATAAETIQLLDMLDHPALKVIWDPANAYVAGEQPFPDGYGRLPSGRIAHVHAKDCVVRDGAVIWGPLGEMSVDWKGQFDALVEDGYKGWISLETHWPGPGGDKLEASLICGRRLHALALGIEQSGQRGA